MIRRKLVTGCFAALLAATTWAPEGEGGQVDLPKIQNYHADGELDDVDEEGNPIKFSFEFKGPMFIDCDKCVEWKSGNLILTLADGEVLVLVFEDTCAFF